MYGAHWFVARHKDVLSVLRSKDFSVCVDPSPDAFLARSFSRQDTPEHGRLRGVISDLFAPQAVLEWNKRIQNIVSGVLVRINREQNIEFVSQFAKPIELAMIADLLGIQESDAPVLSREYKRMQQGNATAANAAVAELKHYFRTALAHQHSAEEGRLLPRLAYALQQQIINETEAVDTCLTIVVAGLGAMAHLLSTGMLALLQHKDQHNQLIRSPDLIPQALEEMLRYEPATNFTSIRVAMQSVQLSNVEIPSGARVICLLAAANRDQLIFERPDVFDIHRQPTKHLAFGGGIHQCLGNTLFRLAGRTVLLELLNTSPKLRLRRGLAGCQPSHSWIRAASTRGLRHLFLTH